MFTSRAEFRLLLRADNADQRLTDKGITLGCVGEGRAEFWNKKKLKLHKVRELVESLSATPKELELAGFEINQDGRRRTLFDLLKYPNIGWNDLEKVWPEIENTDEDIKEQIEIDAIYSGYIARQQADVDALRRDEALKIPATVDYAQIGGLSNEVQQKLNDVKPETLGAASRIPGVTPAAVIALLRHVKKRNAA